jgi:glycosyltransferase involved in cell wall biosynthesis
MIVTKGRGQQGSAVERGVTTRKLRVLAVTNHYPTAEMQGDTPCIRDQILMLSQMGLEVDVLQLDRTARRLSYVKVAWRLFLASFQRKRYDLIHAYYGYTGLLARLQVRYPVVVTFRGSDLLSRWNRFIGPVVAKCVDGVIVMTDEMKQVSRRADARIIPFGVNLQVFRPYPMERARGELGLPPGERLVLFPWDPRRPEKRFDVVQAAVEKLQRDDSNVRLVVVWDKPPATIATYMNACNALVLASDREGAPMTVREAVACNLPVVSVDVGDVRQVIGDIAGCFLCRQDPEDVAQKLRMALQRGRRLEAARVATTLGVREATEQVIQVYQRVLDTRRRMGGLFV